MLFKTRSLRVLLAAAALAAFGGMSAHEAVHVEHASECAVCHVVQKTPVDAVAAACVSLFLILLFRLADPGSRSPEGRFFPVRPGRAPPALLV